MSPHYFIKSIRLKKAAHLLLTRKVSISDAAYATGFSNLARFSNDFKTFFGEAPTEYQRNHTEESE
jgi:transcriptional regulator GlxA family with amidase domain